MQPLKGHSRGSVHSARRIEIARANVVPVPDPNQPQRGSLSVSRAGKEGSGVYSAHS